MSASQVLDTDLLCNGSTRPESQVLLSQGFVRQKQVNGIQSGHSHFTHPFTCVACLSVEKQYILPFHSTAGRGSW